MTTDKVKTVKIQATVSGLPAWALERLAGAKGQSAAEIANYVINRWIDDNLDYLARFGIDLEEFGKAEAERTGRVIQLGESTGNSTK
jgi:hypothetical protein